LKSDGTVVVWGDNTYGQTNIPAVSGGVMAVAASEDDPVLVVFKTLPMINFSSLPAQAISHSAINHRPITINFATGSSGAIFKGALNLRLTGAAGSSVVLERSADLTTWTPFQTNTLPTNILSAGELNLALPPGSNRQQFFRARTQP